METKKSNGKMILTGAMIASAVLGSASMKANTSLFDYSSLGSGSEVRGTLLNILPSAVNALELSCGTSKSTDASCGAKKDDKTAKTKDGKCGEGKCGTKKDDKTAKTKDGKCGEGKCGTKKDEKTAKTKDGKCGEGKCGTKKEEQPK